MIVITYIKHSNSLEFFVISGITSLYPTYQWYLNNIPVWTGSTYLLIEPKINDNVYVTVKENINICEYNSAINDCGMVGSLNLDCYGSEISDCGLEGNVEDILHRAFWHSGHYYGGNFWGTFAGGIFHYGYKNGEYFSQNPIKPTLFIETAN